MSSFTKTQKAIAIAPKVTGFVSFCSSTFIAFHVLRSPRLRKLTYHRLLCGMSMSDMIGSLMCILSTWPIPKGEAYLAAGTVQTCVVQGFLDQAAALCTPMYNVSLAIYYLLVIVKGWKEQRILRVEKFLHALPIAAGLGTSIAGIFLNLYNSAGWICWIAPGLPNHPDNHNQYFGIYRIAFMYANAWAINFFLAVSMAVIYFHVLRQEKCLDKYNVPYCLAVKRRMQSNKIRDQAFLYVGCMYMTWLFGSTFRLMQFAGKTPPAALIVLFVTFFPLQGFFNLVVYMFPKIVLYLESRRIKQSRLESKMKRTSLSATKISSVAESSNTNDNTTGEAMPNALCSAELGYDVDNMDLDKDDKLGDNDSEEKQGCAVEGCNTGYNNAMDELAQTIGLVVTV